MTESRAKVAPPNAVILAGGTSRRMGGGDKGLLTLGTRQIIEHVIDRIAPQVEALAINANGDPARFEHLQCPVIPDTLPDTPGPLAGILAAMQWARERGADYVITVSGDTPFLPGDLVPRLILASETSPSGMSVATSDGRLHPTCGLWPVSLYDDLSAALDAGTRRVTDWVAMYEPTHADWAISRLDPFFNINTPEDLASAEAWL